SLRPTTIAMIYKSDQNDDTGLWSIFGNVVNQVTVVATLISKSGKDNSTMFVIDDGTGRIDAFHWNLPDLALEVGTIGEIVEGKYVRATGKIKINNNGRRHLQLSHIRMSSDPHELYYHLADVMVTELVLKRGPVS
ncbi:hypothetical protein PILCRDRAFT_56417, partial [Piloderma croceum F 1598]